MKLIDLLTKDERQQLRVRYDDASFPDYVNELLDKEVDTVKHGRWIYRPTFPTDTPESPTYHIGVMMCSVCGVKVRNATPLNYCANCGAQMEMD